MIKIAYSGSLGGFDPNIPLRKGHSFLHKWFWTFNNDIVDASTRSGYYLIQAIKILKNDYQIQPKSLQISWWGKIDPLNLKQVNDENLDAYFTHAGYLPKQESIKRISEADLLFLPLEKSNVPERGTLFIPGKLFEYLNSGKPILALCEESDCKMILAKSGLGIFAPPDNPLGIAELLLQIIRGEIKLASFIPNLRFIERFSFIHKTQELAEVFDECLKDMVA